MIIGVISDSHDNVPMLERAMAHFNHAGCELVIHAGDVVAPFAMATFRLLNCPFRAIYGNNDGEKVGLKLKAAAVGGSIEAPPLVVEAGGRRLLVLHDCSDWRAEAARSGAEVVIFGHTHEVVIERDQDGPLGLNPGESGGWLTGNCTVALLDTADLAVRLLDLKLDPGKEIRA